LRWKCRNLFQKNHLREALLHYFILKKNAAEMHRLLVNIYDKHASSNICKEWFRRFKNGNFDVRDKECEGALKKFEELQAWFEEDPCRSLNELLKSEFLNIDRFTVEKRLYAMGMVQKKEKWVPYKLKERETWKDVWSCARCFNDNKGRHFCIESYRDWRWKMNLLLR